MPTPLLRKAQSQLLEVILVMIILVVLVTVVITAISYTSKTAAVQEQLQRRQATAETIVTTLRTRTELRCPAHITQTALCIDAHRANHLSDFLEDNETVQSTYFDLLGPTTLTINPVYPPADNQTLYNATDPDATTLAVRTPITYYNATTRTKHYATLRIQAAQ